jgi:hypothetical protein
MTILRTLGQKWPREVGQSKGKISISNPREILEKKKVMDGQSRDIEKAFRREIDLCSGCNGLPHPSKGQESPSSALIRKPQSNPPPPATSWPFPECL